MSPELITIFQDAGIDPARLPQVIRAVKAEYGSASSSNLSPAEKRRARNRRYYLKRRARERLNSVLQPREPIMVKTSKLTTSIKTKRLTKSSAPMCNNIYNNNLSPLEPELNLGLESNTKDSPNDSDRSLKPEREGVRSKKSDDWRDDRRREVWRIGLQLLQSVGLPENKARIMIGKWIKGLSVDSLLTILQKAHQQGVLDPIPYVEKAVRNVRQRYASAEAETADCFYSNTKNWREIERRETMYIP